MPPPGNRTLLPDEPDQHELLAVVAFWALLRRMIDTEQGPTDDEPRARRISALIGLATLIGAVPPERGMIAINQVLMIADPDILTAGPVVDALSGWPGGTPEEGLRLASGIAVNRARRIFRDRPERAMAFRNYLRHFSLEDYIGRD